MNKNNNNALSYILDSSLISATNFKTFQVKLVDCVDYVQLYFYKNKKFKSNQKDFELELKNSKNIDVSLFTPAIDSPDGETKETKLNDSKNIELKNIIRSKLECQRLAKCNINDWKTFITLTFEDNIKDIDIANKKLHSYLTQVKKNKTDFKYLCIPEFQKRGAVHYHLLTNLEVDTLLIPKRIKKRLYNKETKSYKELEYYDLKYWSKGFSSAEPITNDPKKIIGYISKYMTKDIDNRLFNKKRYFYSINLNKPVVNYIDFTSQKDLEFYYKKIQDKEVTYQNEYINTFDNEPVLFLELLN